jgi:hypothetical protein
MLVCRNYIYIYMCVCVCVCVVCLQVSVNGTRKQNKTEDTNKLTRN